MTELYRRFSNVAVEIMQGINSLNPKHRNTAAFLLLSALPDSPGTMMFISRDWFTTVPYRENA